MARIKEVEDLQNERLKSAFRAVCSFFEHKSVVYNRIFWGVLVIAILVNAYAIGHSYVITYTRETEIERHDALQDEVKQLKSEATNLETLANANKAELQSQIASLEGRVNVLAWDNSELRSQMNTKQGDIALEETDAETIELRYRVEVSDFAATMAGSDAFHIMIEAVEDSNGPLSLKAAELHITDLAKQVSDACIVRKRDSASYSLAPESVGRYISSRRGAVALPVQCWQTLSEVVGYPVNPSENLPLDALDELESHRGVGNQETLFVDKQTGKIIGYWYGIVPDLTSTCLHNSLRAVGVEEGSYITLDRNNEYVISILSRSEMLDLDRHGELIPDLCGIANLKQSEKPVWAKMVGFNQIRIDRHGFRAEFKLHQIPEGVLVERITNGSGAPWKVIRPGDLILLDLTFGDMGYMYYLTMDHTGRLHWYEPFSAGSELSGFQRVPVILINPDTDGLGPFFQTGDGTAYYAHGEIHHQGLIREYAGDGTDYVPTQPAPVK